MVRTGYGILRPDVDVLWDLGVHDIIISTFLVHEIPHSVSAWGESLVFHGQINMACLLLSFRSGIRVFIRASWLEAARRREIAVIGMKGMCILRDAGAYQSLEIFDGDIKSLSSYQNKQSTKSQKTGMNQKHYKIPTTSGIITEAQHFAACIQNKKKPICDANDGLNTVRILEAAQLSMCQ